MNKQILADSHSHTTCSPDGRDSVLEMCEKAKSLEFSYYTVADHCECNDYKGIEFGFNYEKGVRFSAEKVAEAREIMTAPGFTVLRGMELGQPMQNIKAAEDALDREHDFVLASVHNIKNFEDFYYLDYEKTSDAVIDELLQSYFSEIMETIEWGRFDAIAHLTYPLRYIVGDHKRSVDIKKHMGSIEKIFAIMIEKNKALEVNTSGLRQNIGCLLPNESLLKRYHEMGGRLVTLGSDAHTSDDLGKGISEGIAVLKSVGFDEYAVYIEHKPKMVSIL